MEIICFIHGLPLYFPGLIFFSLESMILSELLDIPSINNLSTPIGNDYCFGVNSIVFEIIY